MDIDVINKRYKIYEPLNAEHGIYSGYDILDNKKVVIKVLSVFCEDVYASLINKPINNIPQIYSIFKRDDRLIVVEQYIEGRNLQQMLDDNIYFITKDVCNIIIQLCNILKQVHQRKIIHRDIKPSNIIVDTYNKVSLIDFNASKFENNQKNTDTVLLGTVGYASPEQYGFSVSTTSSDIYSLGVLINVLQTHKFPNEQLCSKPLNKIVKKCTEMDPKKRYHNVDELLLDIRVANKELIPLLRTFTPVGFRSGKVWKMILSFVITFLYISACLVSNFQGAGEILNWINRIILMLIFLINVGFVFDYRGIREQFGLDKFGLLANIISNIVFLTSSIILFIMISSVAENILK